MRPEINRRILRKAEGKSGRRSEIMNTDESGQFTSFAWTDRLRRSGVRLSPPGRWMDGKGQFFDNIFVARL